MPLLFRRKAPALDNELDVHSGWPVRLTDFSLENDYVVEKKDYPEIYLVTGGTVLHTSPTGRQSLRPGSVVVAHAGTEHGFAEPDSAKMISLGFLPEWLAGEFDVIQRCPDAGFDDLASDRAARFITGRKGQLAGVFAGLAMGHAIQEWVLAFRTIRPSSIP